MVISEVNLGKEAANTGKTLMDNVVSNFNSMTASFEKVRSMSSQENKNIQDISDNFNKIMSQISNIAEISQDHSAYIEEIRQR